MRTLTIEQRESLQAELEAWAESLREDIAKALRAAADLEADLDVAALQRHLNELREVEQGLVHSCTPDYGICAACGVEIPYSRLSANPTAMRCAGCQACFEHEWPRIAEHTV